MRVLKIKEFRACFFLNNAIILLLQHPHLIGGAHGFQKEMIK